MNRLLVCTLFSAAFVGAGAQDNKPAAAKSSAPASGTRTCSVNRSLPSDADLLLARKSYSEAEAKYREMLSKEPGSEEARLGIVRSLIGEDKVAEAQSEAAEMLQRRPKSVLAEVASSEAAYRAGDPDAAYTHAKAALTDDGCEGRAYTAVADYLDLNAYFAKSANFVAKAHALRPNDELIQREWVDSLPRKERQVELARYLSDAKALSEADKHGLTNELEHLKAHRPGECRISSKADTVKTKLQYVFGDSSRPVAFGLDVMFDGKRRRMQIDTGASGIVLTKAAARGLGLEPEYRIKTGGIGDEGEAASFLTHVKNIRIGDVEVSDCMVEVIEKSKLDVDGLIGMDVFDRWLVTLDYQAAELRLVPLPPRPEAATPARAAESNALPGDVGDAERKPQDRYIAPDMKDWEQFLRIGHEILLPATVGKGAVHYLMMDTGASASVLSTAMGKEAGKLHGSLVEFMGISGKVKKVYEVDQVSLTVANLRLASETMFSYDFTQVSHGSGFEVSGFLGLPTLQRLSITIDYRDNLLKLKYDPKNDQLRF